MPSRNILKIDVEEGYYHIYARGVNKDTIFKEDTDYHVFLNLLKRYLSKEARHDTYGVPYIHLYNKLELLCYCLMPNHFHLLIYQNEKGAMPTLMRGVMTSYSRYFNKKYQRRGPLFESRYKASLILNDSYLEHITRYIHLNPRDYKTYPYSSLPYYISTLQAEWVRPGRIIELFNNTEYYTTFLEDYEDIKKMNDEIKHELANDTTPYF